MPTGAANTNDVRDLAHYKPADAKALLKGLSSVAIAAAGAAWNALEADVTAHLTLIAQQTLSTQAKLAANDISEKEADHTISLLQLNRNAVLLEAKIVPYIVGQMVLDAVCGVVQAVIRKFSGVDLNF